MNNSNEPKRIIYNLSSMELNTWYDMKSNEYERCYNIPYVFINNYGKYLYLSNSKLNEYLSDLKNRKNKIIKIDLPCKFVVELYNGEYYICTYKINFCNKKLKPLIEYDENNMSVIEQHILPCIDEDDCFYYGTSTISIKDVKRYMIIEKIDNCIEIEINKLLDKYMKKYYIPLEINEKPKRCSKCLFNQYKLCKVLNIYKCPIIELPEYKNEIYMDIIEHQSFDAGRARGFNECLNNIYGKTSSFNLEDILSEDDEEDIGFQGEVYNDR